VFVHACARVHVCVQGVYKLNTGVVSILQYNTQKMFLAQFKEFGLLIRRTCYNAYPKKDIHFVILF